MKNFLAATILTLVATQVMASAEQIDIVECHTEHYSVIVSLVGELRVAQVIKTPTSGQEIAETYQSGISASEKRRIMSGESFGLSALTPVADGLKSIIVIADGQQSILVDDGNPTSAVCEPAK